jgi:poly-gamma-glutamate system protein
VKQVYWKPNQPHSVALALIAVLSILGLVSVEVFQTKNKQSHYREKTKAAHLAQEAFERLKEKRLQLKIPIDIEIDPMESGLLGTLMTPVTSNTGSLSAKQTSVNPNFAAVIVRLLKRVEVTRGDIVAVGFSGSFPAINVCVLAAIETLKLKPIIITSVSASSWGANIPEFLWINMEQYLNQRRLFSYRTQLASIGGVEDRGIGISKEGIALMKQAIARSRLPFLDPENYAESIEERMRAYIEYAQGEPIKAYINVGGGTTSVGTKIGKLLFRPGLNQRAPIGGSHIDSVMNEMIKRGTPVIHLIQIEQLAKQYGLQVQPKKMPIVGEGKIFYRKEYNRYLTSGILAGILFILYIFIQSDWGFRIMLASRRRKTKGYPEPMV